MLPAAELDNIEVFSLCVAEIMEELYGAFPIPINVSPSRVVALYEPPEEVTQPRIVQVNDQDYEALLPFGYRTDMSLSLVVLRHVQDYHQAKPGAPFYFWTGDQKNAFRPHYDRSQLAKRIHEATMTFLADEGYLREFWKENSRLERIREVVLTSKGFSHLNKRFERGRIRDDFHIATKLISTVKMGGDIAAGAKDLLDPLMRFLDPSGLV